ncbi:undecaprenyl-diphosphate phosphatase [Bacillus sp. CLL-7-23]|uniref:Undecaprenyl-diphosphatase n=1 Tax=Bacillus changyiensis TaxID=3004103 RepID=A0ABT4X3V7_9BACI|nr:undecaprenyl-diphosphate phosphatase [Bacillus changyiensis]MDA7026077.1 undecaprenyl-diphosphate phosphatase [Bacillus changyiensis]
MDFLMLIKYILLGLLQGLTEPIPVSSSGHLVLAQHFLGLEIEGFSFELLVNAGSLIAVLLVYQKDIIRLTKNGLSYVVTKDQKGKADFRFIIYLITATIPAGVIGVLFDDEISAFFKDGVRVTAITLLITGLALFLIRNLRGRKHDGEMRLKDAVIIGLSQMIALIPGISRSGATIVPAMALGLKSETALRFSFLLYIPVSLGGTILSINDIFHDPHLSELFVPYLFAFIASIIATYFSLRWFMNIMAKGNLIYFSVYCFIVGGAVFIFA